MALSFTIQADLSIQEVIHKYAELQQQYHNKSEDYENELASRRMWQAQARNFERSLQTTNMGLVCSIGFSKVLELLTYSRKQTALS